MSDIDSLIRELQRMKECGCTTVEVLVLAHRGGKVYQVAAVDRPSYRTPANDVAVLTIAPAR